MMEKNSEVEESEKTHTQTQITKSDSLDVVFSTVIH